MADDEIDLARMIGDLAKVGLTKMRLLTQRDGPVSSPLRLAEWVALLGPSFTGFAGTPIEKANANTLEAFGGYVSTGGHEG